MALNKELEEITQHLQAALRVMDAQRTTIQEERLLRLQAEAQMRQLQAQVATMTSTDVGAVLALARQVEHAARDVAIPAEPRPSETPVPP